LICPYCAEKIKNEAIVCRFCGRDLPKNVETQIVQAKSTQSITANVSKFSAKKRQLQFLVGISILIVAVGIFFLTKSESENITACKSEVSGYLKQPSTAEWQRMSETEELNSDDLVKFPDGSVKKDTTAIVTGSVKSQNAFGAMLTTNFKCSKPVWEDYWEVETWEDGDSAP